MTSGSGGASEGESGREVAGARGQRLAQPLEELAARVVALAATEGGALPWELVQRLAEGVLGRREVRLARALLEDPQGPLTARRAIELAERLLRGEGAAGGDAVSELSFGGGPKHES